MHILVLSFYYEPDLSAGSFRNTAVVKNISKVIDKDSQVDVITTLPNRYHSYLTDAPLYQENDNVRIWRVPLPAHKNGMLDQSRAFLSYFKAAILQARSEKYDVVYASSSRLMTAFLGAIISRRYKVPLYLDIRDIFTDSMSDLLEKSPLRILLPILRRVEKFTIQQASRVNLVSPGFVNHYKSIDSDKDYSCLTNGIDKEFIQFDFKNNNKNDNKEIIYAGNIGEGQGLHHIIPLVAKKLGVNWKIRIIGDGSMKPCLEKSLLGLENVILEPPVQREKLLEEYRKADVLFLHLNNYQAFKKVLPSKLFEYAATGKPILAGVAGSAADFINSNIKNAAVFEPCDDSGFLSGLEQLSYKPEFRTEFIKKYDRESIVLQLVNEVIALGV